MSSYDPYGNNARNTPADTADVYDMPSAAPFVSPVAADPHTKASWGSTGDAEFHATVFDCTVQADGSVVTHAKAGPANISDNDA